MTRYSCFPIADVFLYLRPRIFILFIYLLECALTFYTVHKYKLRVNKSRSLLHFYDFYKDL